MALIHISEAEAARDFSGLMARVRAGERVVIEDGSSPVAILEPVVTPPVRRLSESLRLARELGSTATLDGAFADDLQAAVDSHRETLTITWD